MHFGPIFRALMHHKSRVWLVTLEVALTLAIVVNCINVMLDLRSLYVRDSGIEEESILTVSTLPFAEEFEDEDYVDEVRRADLDLQRVVQAQQRFEVGSISEESKNEPPAGADDLSCRTRFSIPDRIS